MAVIFVLKEFRRNSSISGQSSASEDNDTEQLSSSLPRRGRRQAIFDSKVGIHVGLHSSDFSEMARSALSSFIEPIIVG